MKLVSPSGQVLVGGPSLDILATTDTELAPVGFVCQGVIGIQDLQRVKTLDPAGFVCQGVVGAPDPTRNKTLDPGGFVCQGVVGPPNPESLTVFAEIDFEPVGARLDFADAGGAILASAIAGRMTFTPVGDDPHIDQP